MPDAATDAMLFEALTTGLFLSVAESYARFAPHEYTTRWTCRERGIEDQFEAFVRLIESDGFWRPWGRHRWRTPRPRRPRLLITDLRVAAIGPRTVHARRARMMPVRTTLRLSRAGTRSACRQRNVELALS